MSEDLLKNLVGRLSNGHFPAGGMLGNAALPGPHPSGSVEVDSGWCRVQRAVFPVLIGLASSPSDALVGSSHNASDMSLANLEDAIFIYALDSDRYQESVM